MKSLYNILCINMNNLLRMLLSTKFSISKKVKKSLPRLENKLHSHQKEDIELMHFLISAHLYVKGGWKEQM